MKLFVSHVSEEKELAICLKHWIESTTSGLCSVFVSSHPSDLTAGDKWLDKINEALNKSSLVIILYSKFSMAQPWISFEAGCAWVKQIPIIPIYHTGLKPDDLRLPISNFQHISLEQDNLFDMLFGAIYEHAKLPKIPQVDKDKFESEVRKIAETIQDNIRKNDVSNDKFVPEKLQEKILTQLSIAKDNKKVGLDEIDLCDKLDVSISVMSHALNQLVSQYLVTKGSIIYNGSYVPNANIYAITEGGISLLIQDNNLLSD